MFDFSTVSEVTIVGVVGVVVVGGWVAIAFYRSHRAFKARECLYHSLCQRIKRGEQVSPSEYEKLTPADRATLQIIQQTSRNIAGERPAKVAASPPVLHQHSAASG